MHQGIQGVLSALALPLAVSVAMVIGCLLFARWFKARGKGMIGELAVNLQLRRMLPEDTYHIIANVMLPVEGGTTQIDHIVVSRYGIFVIETKALKGWIYGREGESHWTQKLFRKSYRFQNPLRQNYLHTQTLAELTGIPHQCFISLVAFSGEATFKTPMPASVMHIRDIARSILSHSAVLIREEQVPEVAEAIRAWEAAVDGRARRNHVRNLKSRKA